MRLKHTNNPFQTIYPILDVPEGVRFKFHEKTETGYKYDRDVGPTYIRRGNDIITTKDERYDYYVDTNWFRDCRETLIRQGTTVILV